MRLPFAALAFYLFCTLPVTAQTPEVVRSPRLAAVRFAMQHGFEVPRTRLIVAVEADFGTAKDVAAARARKSTAESSSEQLAAEALEIARAIGPEVRVGWAASLLNCPEMKCYAPGDVSVLVVNVYPGEAGVYIKLYSPGTPSERPSLYHAIVETEQYGSGWIGTRFSLLPKRMDVR